MPLVPPSDYFGSGYQNAEGKQKVDAWFAGYPQGVRAAQAEGVAKLTMIDMTKYLPAPENMPTQQYMSPNQQNQNILSPAPEMAPNTDPKVGMGASPRPRGYLPPIVSPTGPAIENRMLENGMPKIVTRDQVEFARTKASLISQQSQPDGLPPIVDSQAIQPVTRGPQIFEKNTVEVGVGKPEIIEVPSITPPATQEPIITQPAPIFPPITQVDKLPPIEIVPNVDAVEIESDTGLPPIVVPADFTKESANQPSSEMSGPRVVPSIKTVSNPQKPYYDPASTKR